ncbi:MAG: PhzF family phenazine biosynthesis protein [Rhodanobacter sp.]
MALRFRWLQLDVFSEHLFAGNPLAVVVDAAALDARQMQRIARWTNLSETAFLLPATQVSADYRVRIFTPRQELPFAGHPSVGSAYVALEAGAVRADKTQLIQECAAGLLPVRVDGHGPSRRIHVQAPAARITSCGVDVAERLAAALRVTLAGNTLREVDNGPHWLVCDLDRADAVRALRPDMSALAAVCTEHGVIGACVFGHEHDGTAAMAVRAFCPADGIPEDPVTGSANAAIAACLQATGALPAYGQHYRVSQGREVGRDGYVEVNVNARTGAISIGGACCIGLSGQLRLPDDC